MPVPAPNANRPPEIPLPSGPERHVEGNCYCGNLDIFIMHVFDRTDSLNHHYLISEPVSPNSFRSVIHAIIRIMHLRINFRAVADDFHQIADSIKIVRILPVNHTKISQFNRDVPDLFTFSSQV